MKKIYCDYCEKEISNGLNLQRFSEYKEEMIGGIYGFLKPSSHHYCNLTCLLNHGNKYLNFLKKRSNSDTFSL